MYALFLTEIVDDALQTIKEKNNDDLSGLYKQLLDEENEFFRNFEASTNFKYAHKWDLEGTELTTELFYHHKVYCHTARLPAQTRYKGHVFGKERDDDWHGSFKKGVAQSGANRKPEQEMRVTYAPREKHNCSVPLHIDSRDFFFATPAYGDYQTATLPNIVEFKNYGPHKPQGLLAVCAAACTHTMCNGFKLLGAKDVNEGTDVLMQVNGEPVAKATPFDDCFLLQRASGDYYWDPTPEGRYVVGVKILHPKRFFRISSFLVW